MKGRDVLCFGDSLVKFGVLPRLIEAKTGLKSYNLAVNAGTMPSAYFLLRRALESGAKPKAIVADFLSLDAAREARKSIRLYPDLATPGDCLDLAMTARDPDFFTATLLAKLLPSYKCRFEIRASVQAALEGRRASPWPSQSVIWATWKDQNGAQPMPTNPSRPAAQPVLVSDLSPADWTCDPINAAYFDRFLDLAKSRDIPVFWVILPLSPEIHASRAVTGSDEAYDRFARAALDRHPTSSSSTHGTRATTARSTSTRSTSTTGGEGPHQRRGCPRQRPAQAQDPAPRWVELPAFARSEEVARAGVFEQK